MSKPHIKFIKNTIINIIINYNHAQHLEIAIDDTLARNLSKSFDFEIKFEMMLRNVFSEFSRYNRDFEL